MTSEHSRRGLRLRDDDPSCGDGRSS
jgi:hypothetical protein